VMNLLRRGRGQVSHWKILADVSYADRDVVKELMM
jgi:hypothetical protein